MAPPSKKLPRRSNVNAELSSTPRRRLLQALGVAGAVSVSKIVPDQWRRPVVDSVMLPAHARSTGPTGPSTIQLIGPVGSGAMGALDQPHNLFAHAGDLVGAVVPSALANHMTGSLAYCATLSTGYCITINAVAPDGQVSITINGGIPGTGTNTLNGLSIPLTGVGPWHVSGSIDGGLAMASGDVLDETGGGCGTDGEWNATSNGACLNR